MNQVISYDIHKMVESRRFPCLNSNLSGFYDYKLDLKATPFKTAFGCVNFLRPRDLRSTGSYDRKDRLTFQHTVGGPVLDEL